MLPWLEFFFCNQTHHSVHSRENSHGIVVPQTKGPPNGTIIGKLGPRKADPPKMRNRKEFFNWYQDFSASRALFNLYMVDTKDVHEGLEMGDNWNICAHGDRITITQTYKARVYHLLCMCMCWTRIENTNINMHT